jgi:hypothetical protein
MSTYNVLNNEEKELRSATYPKKGMMKMDDKEKPTPTIIMRKR